MKKIVLVSSLAFLVLLYGNSCTSGKSTSEDPIATDSVSISKGQSIYSQQCSGCHNFRQEGIGPALGGITKSMATSWIEAFIHDPKKLVADGDAHAKELFDQYHVPMPAFGYLTKEQTGYLIAFLNTHLEKVQPDDGKHGKPITNPIPKSIVSSGLQVEISLLAKFPPTSDDGRLPLTRITKFEVGPTGIIYVLDLRGKLYQLRNNQPEVYMDMASLMPKFINKPGLATGFGSFAFHPDFARNGLLYTTHTESAGTAKPDFGIADSIKKTLQWVLTEWKADNPAAKTFSGKGRELFRIDMVSGIHGVQEINFNPLARPGNKEYGLLYICIGDGGAAENGYAFLAHSKEKPWGTILRIDPGGRNSRNGKYGIPENNPFAHDKDDRILSEIYAYGFRNPHRITWSKSGQMLASNIGHSNIEAIDLILPGHDYGWPIREGRFLINPYGELGKVYALPADDSLYQITYPVAAYDHDEGKAISGGFAYEGSAIPALKEKFLFGDIPKGRLFYVQMSDLKQGQEAEIKEWQVYFKDSVRTLAALCGTDRVDLHFGRDNHGEIYILTKPDGRLYKLVKARKEALVQKK